jgi:hypothetical protein
VPDGGVGDPGPTLDCSAVGSVGYRPASAGDQNWPGVTPAGGNGMAPVGTGAAAGPVAPIPDGSGLAGPAGGVSFEPVLGSQVSLISVYLPIPRPVGRMTSSIPDPRAKDSIKTGYEFRKSCSPATTVTDRRPRPSTGRGDARTPADRSSIPGTVATGSDRGSPKPPVNAKLQAAGVLQSIVAIPLAMSDTERRRAANPRHPMTWAVAVPADVSCPGGQRNSVVGAALPTRRRPGCSRGRRSVTTTSSLRSPGNFRAIPACGLPWRGLSRGHGRALSHW